MRIWRAKVLLGSASPDVPVAVDPSEDEQRQNNSTSPTHQPHSEGFIANMGVPTPAPVAHHVPVAEAINIDCRTDLCSPK